VKKCFGSPYTKEGRQARVGIKRLKFKNKKFVFEIDAFVALRVSLF